MARAASYQTIQKFQSVSGVSLDTELVRFDVAHVSISFAFAFVVCSGKRNFKLEIRKQLHALEKFSFCP